MTDEARPFDPTPRRIRRARERGEVPRSRLLSGAVAFAAAALVAGLGAEAFVLGWREAVVALWSSPLELDAAGAMAALGARTLAPVLAAAVLGGAAASLVQVGPLVAPAALRPELERLSPAAGLRRVVDGAVGRLAPFVLGALLVAIGAGVLHAALADTLGRTAIAPARALSSVGVVLAELAWRALFVLLSAGALAYAHARWRWWQGLRMSRRERLEEQRQTLGDPAARRRRAQERRRRAFVPSVAEAAEQAALLVEGERELVAVRWDGGDGNPTLLLAARGPSADALRRSAPSVPRARDAALAAQLAALEAGAAVPRGMWRRLARALARSANA